VEFNYDPHKAGAPLGIKRKPAKVQKRIRHAVRDDIETRAKRGNLETLDRILARVPARPPVPGDEL
jgi:hypothetical protein